MEGGPTGGEATNVLTQGIASVQGGEPLKNFPEKPTRTDDAERRYVDYI